MSCCQRYKVHGCDFVLMMASSASSSNDLKSDTVKFALEILPSQNAITAGTTTWKVGTPVFFIIRMRNNSEHVLHFVLTGPAYNYLATVLDSNGKAVPETENLRNSERW